MATDISQFLPNVPRTPPVRTERASDGNMPAPRRRRTKPNTQTDRTNVTATVTKEPVRRRASPPVAPPAPEEDKRTKFLRIGGGRMVNVLRSIRLLGNLANRAVYGWNDEDVETMRKAIDAQLDASFKKFAARSDTKLEHTFHFEH